MLKEPQEILKLTLGRVDMVLVLLQLLVLSRHVVLHGLHLPDSCFTSCSLEIGVKPTVGTPAKALLRLGIPEVAGVPRRLDVELGTVGPLALHRLGLADLRAAHAGFFELVIFMHNFVNEILFHFVHRQAEFVLRLQPEPDLLLLPRARKLRVEVPLRVELQVCPVLRDGHVLRESWGLVAALPVRRDPHLTLENR